MAEAVACPKCGSKRVDGSCPNCRPGGSATSTKETGPVDIATFAKGVVDLGLSTVEELRTEVKRAGGDVVNLARSLVAAKTLSSYQATVLLQGKGRKLTVGPYLLLERRGGRSVFKARHRKTGREVALKLVATAAGGDVGERLRERLAAAAKVKHPNLVGLFGMGDDSGQTYIVMEHADGRNLQAVVGEVGPLPVDMALDAAIQAARGLAAAHAAGLSHGAFDLTRLVLTAKGDVRLVGLGQSPSAENHLKADIRALGSILYGLLTGQSPSDAADSDAKAKGNSKGTIPSPRRVRDDIPEGVDAACMTLLGTAKGSTSPLETIDEAVALLSARLPDGEIATKARVSLKACAEEAIQRGIRAREKGPDLSVFARREEGSGIVDNPDLGLEDLVMDFREEAKAMELTEDQLAPMLPRFTAPTVRHPVPTRLLLTLGGAVGLVVALMVAANALRSRLGSFSIAEAPKVTIPPPKPKPRTLPTLKPEPIKPTKPTIQPLTSPKVLFVDEFDTPRNDWLVTTTEERADSRRASRGYQNGLLVFGVQAYNVNAMNTVSLPGEYREAFTCEVDTRVTTDTPDTPKSEAVIRIIDVAGGIQVGLDREGRIQILPTSGNFRNNPWHGPISHPAIQRGLGAFNRIRVDVRRRVLTVRVNGQRVCPPLELAFDILPARVEIGLDPMRARSIAEFERVEIAELNSEDSEADNVEPVAFFHEKGAKRLPDGTFVYEAGTMGHDRSYKSIFGGHIYNIMEFNKFTNDYYILWTPKRSEVIELEIPFESEGRYRVIGRFERSKLGAKVQVELDRHPLNGNEPIDLEGPSGSILTDIDLGTYAFTKGTRTFRLTCVGVPGSRSNREGLVKIDEFRFVPVQ